MPVRHADTVIDRGLGDSRGQVAGGQAAARARPTEGTRMTG